MTEVVREFLSCLSAEELIFHSRLVEDSYGLAFLTAIKEFDHYYYNLIRHEASDTAAEHFYLMRLAVPRLIQQTFTSIPRFKVPIATFRSDRALILAALNMVARFGFVEHGKRMAHAVMAGECELAKLDNSLYEFRLPAELYNYEAHESYVADFHRQQRRNHRDRLIKETFDANGTLAHLNECFEENVYVFREHFIGYNAHPDLDDYFFGLAYSDLEDHGAFDTFHHDLTFGGLQYRHYVLCAAYFLSLSMKHERFCEALVRKHPEIRLRDILTITADKDEFIGSIQAALNRYGPSFEHFSPISIEEATLLYDVLSVRRENLNLLGRGLMSLPYLIEFSNSAIIKCIAGAQLDLSEFLLESLRFNFPSECDRHQQTREGAMQEAVRRLLRGSFPTVEFRDNIRIRKDNRVLTDIDLVAIEGSSHTAILFQLKHQDHYGGDIKKRSNRAERLRSETEAWLGCVNKWLEQTPRQQLCSSLQLKKSVRIDYFHVVAIGKNFAHFLWPLASDANFAYANWIQFYDAVARTNAMPGGPRTLGDLFAVLREYMSHKTAASQHLEGSDLFILDTVKYRIVQKAQADNRGNARCKSGPLPAQGGD
jgi:hypothetical protein